MMKNFAYLLLLCVITSACLDDTVRSRPTLTRGDSITDDDDGSSDFEAPTRPDGDVYLQSGSCGCSNGEPITLGDCSSFCSGKTHAEEILYIDVEVGEEISTSNFQNFYGWCNTTLTYTDPDTGELVTDGVEPSCVASLKDENGDVLEVGLTIGSSKTISMNMGTMESDKTYRLEVIETTSGASSNTVQIRKVSDRIGDPVGGPLRLMPVNQYTCMTRSLSTDEGTGDNYYEDAARTHYYFIDEDRPEPLSQTYANIYCHDYIIYGTTPINDPLLEETPGAFTVWDKWDPRFFDLDGADENGTTIEIHKILGQKIQDLGYSIDSDPEVFYPLEYYNGPPISDSGEDIERKQLGYYMLPFVNESTFKAYCPTAVEYNSDNPLFQAMRDVVGVDTEGLFIAKQDNVCDILLIGETLLKQIWFYKENGLHLEPNSDTVAGKQIQFYWPADTESPYIRKSHQKTYTVKRATDNLCGDSNVSENQADMTSSYPSHDKRIGCIPKF